MPKKMKGLSLQSCKNLESERLDAPVLVRPPRELYILNFFSSGKTSYGPCDLTPILAI